MGEGGSADLNAGAVGEGGIADSRVVAGERPSSCRRIWCLRIKFVCRPSIKQRAAQRASERNELLAPACVLFIYPHRARFPHIHKRCALPF